MNKTAVVAMALLCLLLMAYAHAQTLWSPMVPYTPGPRAPGGGGAMYPGAELPMVPNVPGAAGPPPPTCDGTIDLSTGCVQPMLGGL